MQTQPIFAHVTVTKVVRETVPIEMAEPGFGRTPGELIDEMLCGIASDGGEVQNIELEINADLWGAFAQQHRPQFVGQEWEAETRPSEYVPAKKPRR